MIFKYLATLAIVVSVVTLAASFFRFATRSHVLGGTALEETLRIEFVIEVDSGHTYIIGPNRRQFLEEHIGVFTEGPARILSSKVEVAPTDVSWYFNRTHVISKGATLAARVRWDTPTNLANGTHTAVYLQFPEIPTLEGKRIVIHSVNGKRIQRDVNQKDNQRRYLIREMTIYRDTFPLFVARFVFALPVGLPIGILLHVIVWAFVVKRESRVRLAALPRNGPGWPQTFYPYPTAEWNVWLLVLGIGAFLASRPAGFAVVDDSMSPDLVRSVYIVLAIAVAVALLCCYVCRRSLLTVRVDANGISYARGRGDLRWLNAAWGDIVLLTERSRRGKGATIYWMELEFKDKRKKLKIKQLVQGYGTLRDILKKQVLT